MLSSGYLSKNVASLGADLKKGGYSRRNIHWRILLSRRAWDEGLSPPLTGIYLAVTPSLAPQALIPKYAPFYRSREALKDGMTLMSKSTALYDVAVEPDFASPLWSPLLWPAGHTNLPPTFFQICGADLPRDEALIYERQLRLEHGTKTGVIVYPGLPHIFWYNYSSHTAAKKYVDDTRFALGWLLGRES
ncbi:hypothetical protein CEP54_005474 [Fusarium duplospermum]|uniref:Alpha/beta hydrolase fold-3 domain-containing protein n=1 Tax=Fusarium duplospermum TaxID=1325734 RepID=A0A428QCH2_9HYPO|nr:hypothetical protein CEP54_005474 [Fusarium duplospermum]